MPAGQWKSQDQTPGLLIDKTGESRHSEWQYFLTTAAWPGPVAGIQG